MSVENNFVEELLKEIMKDIFINKDNITKIENNIKNINWDKLFDRKCKEMLKDGRSCEITAKHGHDYCKRHINFKLIKNKQ